MSQCHSEEDGREDDQLTIQSKVDLFRLPPCRDILICHIAHVNHRLANYKRADRMTFLGPKLYEPGQGWEKTQRYLGASGPTLPHSLLLDLVEKTIEEFEEDESEEDEIIS